MAETNTTSASRAEFGLFHRYARRGDDRRVARTDGTAPPIAGNNERALWKITNIVLAKIILPKTEATCYGQGRHPRPFQTTHHRSIHAFHAGRPAVVSESFRSGLAVWNLSVLEATRLGRVKIKGTTRLITGGDLLGACLLVR
jgi:hypothetical protein